MKRILLIFLLSISFTWNLDCQNTGEPLPKVETAVQCESDTCESGEDGLQDYDPDYGEIG